ncbi:MAG: ABC transporter permease [bacterium]
MAMYEWRMGLRYLGSRERKGFFSVLAWIALTGVLVGVMALVVALSFASGFESALRDKIIGINAHLLLLRLDGIITDPEEVQSRLLEMPSVAAVMPFTYQQALLRSGEGVAGTVVRGVPPESLSDIAGWNLLFSCGSLRSLLPPPEGSARAGEPAPILLGRTLAKTLEVVCGDRVDLVLVAGDAGSAASAAALKPFQVAGIFEVGMYEYDASLAFLPLRDSQELFRMNAGVTGFEIRAHRLEQTDGLKAEVQQAFGYPFWAKTWKEINPSFFSALKLQKVVMFLVLILIILVAGFNIISTLIMTVMEKRREIAILKAMGASRRSLGRIFWVQGLVMGLIGTGLGLAGGCGLCWIAGRFPLIRLDPEIYYLSYLPVEVRWTEVALVGLAAVVLCMTATLYPARQASRLDPAEVLRYE